jgi:hypothetical protein
LKKKASSLVTKKLEAFLLIAFLACSLFFTLSAKSISALNGTSQIYFGAFVGPSHKDSLAQLEAFETTVGKGVSIWNWFQLWNRPKDSENSPYFETAWMDECRAHGSIPMITFDPESGYDNLYVYPYLHSIINGNMDTYLHTWAKAAAAWNHPFFIRLFHEFNGDWTDYCPTNAGNSATQFVQAWKHVVDIFRAEGANDVSWIWCPGTQDISGPNLAQLYPGDAYVDWTAMDGYSWDGITTFNQVFSWTYNTILSIAPTKPMMIAEVGCTTTNNEGAWLTDMLSTQLPNNYDHIHAVVIWQDPTDAGSFGVTNSYALSAFEQGISSSYYSSNVYGSLDTSPIPPPNPTTTPTQTLTPSHNPTTLPTPSPSLAATPAPTPTSPDLTPAPAPAPSSTPFPVPSPTSSLSNSPALTAVVAGSTTIMAGQTWGFSVQVDGGLVPYSYQWYQGDTLLTGQTSAELTITKETAGSYSYYCRVVDSRGTVATSNTVTLKVISLQQSPSSAPTQSSYPTTAPSPSSSFSPSPKPMVSGANTESLIVAELVVTIVMVAELLALGLKERKKRIGKETQIPLEVFLFFS